jgi:hypothetical protein
MVGNRGKKIVDPEMLRLEQEKQIVKAKEKILKRKKKLTAYITYKMTNAIRAVLLEEEEANGVKIVFKEDEYRNDRINAIPPEILKHMMDNGKAIVIKEKVISYNGKRNLFGIFGTSTRTLYLHKEKYIRIRIENEDLSELLDNIKEIKARMLEYKVEPKVCVWNRLGRLSIKQKTEEKVPTVKSDFSKQALVDQRELELVTVREGYN